MCQAPSLVHSVGRSCADTHSSSCPSFVCPQMDLVAGGVTVTRFHYLG